MSKLKLKKGLQFDYKGHTLQVTGNNIKDQKVTYLTDGKDEQTIATANFRKIMAEAEGASDGDQSGTKTTGKAPKKFRNSAGQLIEIEEYNDHVVKHRNIHGTLITDSREYFDNFLIKNGHITILE